MMTRQEMHPDADGVIDLVDDGSVHEVLVVMAEPATV